MGVLIPLFRKKEIPEDLILTADQKTRLQLFQNTLEAYRKEEEALENAIKQKCKDELDRLDAIDAKRRQVQVEIENLKKASGPQTSMPRGN